MFSSTKSGLQRSSSSSSIQQSCRLSRLPVRTSTQQSRGKSLCRDKLSVDRNMTRSYSNSEIPRLSRQRSGSLVRKTLNTPLGSSSGRKSPLMSSVRKDIRPITDKRWQYEQTVKVRNFVAAELPYLDHNNIKSGIPLELFVALMDAYFVLIDKRISITRENYIEVVPRNLKRYRYPAAVKPSLMKTVNTPHAWPQVIAIMSWLTDVVYEINGPEDASGELLAFVDNYILKSYTQWIQTEEDVEVDYLLDELNLKLKELIKTDDEAVYKLDKELENLHTEIKRIQTNSNSGIEKIEALKTNIMSINEKCEFYTKENEKFETEMKVKHTMYATKIKKIDQEAAALVKTEDQLKAAIISQHHSFVEKQQLTQEIKDLQTTLKLKEDRQKQLREHVNECDFQISDIKQQMETSAYRYNNVINKLKLTNPAFGELHIRESGFARRDTEDEIIEVCRLSKEAIIKLKQTLEVSDRNVEELTLKHKQIDEELAIVKREEENLMKSEAELEITLTHKKKKEEREREKSLVEINKLQNELLSLKNSRCDFTNLQVELKRAEDEKQEHLKFKQDLLERGLDFFLKLEARVEKNIQTYMNVMEEITAGIISTQENAIENMSKMEE